MATLYVVDDYTEADYFQEGITVNWITSVIFVPKSETTLIQSVPTEIRQLDLNAFHLELRDREDDPDGRPWPPTHTHNTTVEVGGVILARVIEVLAPYTTTFEDGQYAVNLVGANSNVGDRINVNQVSVRSANSAGLQDLSTLLDAAYGGEVAIDTVTSKGQAGTSTPIGTRTNPSNNFADALTIAGNISAKILRLLQPATLTINDFSNGFIFFGDNAIGIMLTIEAGADVANCEFKNLTVQGALDNGNTLRECNILDLSYTNGFVWQCALSGTITLAPGAQATIAESFSNISGGDLSQVVTVDLAVTGSLAVREFNGSIKLINSDGTGDISMDMSSGRVIVDATVIGGTITIRGSAEVIDNSTGTAVVQDKTIEGKLGTAGEVITVPAVDAPLLTQMGYLVAKTANEHNVNASDLQTMRNRANDTDVIQTQLTKTATAFKKGADVNVP